MYEPASVNLTFTHNTRVYIFFVFVDFDQTPLYGRTNWRSTPHVSALVQQPERFAIGKALWLKRASGALRMQHARRWGLYCCLTSGVNQSPERRRLEVCAQCSSRLVDEINARSRWKVPPDHHHLHKSPSTTSDLPNSLRLGTRKAKGSRRYVENSLLGCFSSCTKMIHFSGNCATWWVMTPN